MDVVSLVSSSNRLTISRFRVLGLLGTYTGIYLIHPQPRFSLLRSVFYTTPSRAVIALPISCGQHQQLKAGLPLQSSKLKEQV